MVGNEDRYSARVGDFADAGQYLSALRFRSLGGRLACEMCASEVVVVRYADNTVLGFQH